MLVPILVRAGEPGLVFTLRSAELPTHAGQVSFPGGGKAVLDEDATGTALREADEELGVAPGQVEVVGWLDDQATPSGYVVTPVVGVLRTEMEALRPSPREVAEVFWVSLRALAGPGIFQDRGWVERDGQRYWMCAYVVEGRDIWGATARIVREVLAVEFSRSLR